MKYLVVGGILQVALAGVVVAGTYLPGEGNFDVSVYQTTGERGFHEILTSPFTVHAYTNRAPIDVDARRSASLHGARDGRSGDGRFHAERPL